MDRVRFVKPVFFGDTLPVCSETKSLQRIDQSCGRAVLGINVVTQKDEPVLVFEMRLVVGTWPE